MLVADGDHHGPAAGELALQRHQLEIGHGVCTAFDVDVLAGLHDGTITHDLARHGTQFLLIHFAPWDADADAERGR